jgi:alpha-L-arabinofuranosidase
MTTFTKLEDDAVASIEVDASKKLARIDPMTYGGFTE